MIIEGFYKKDGKFWISEIPTIDFMDQGTTKKECLTFTASAIKDLVEVDGFEVTIKDNGHGHFVLSSNMPRVLLLFILKRIRESRGLSIREAAKKLGHKSHTEYARHESGKTKVGAEVLGTYLSGLSDDAFALSIVKTDKVAG